MATAPMPGAYPFDDSVPPSPDDTMHQPAQPDPSHRQRHKLHKPNNPRGHKYADSGVGFTNPEPVRSSGPPDFNRNGPSEAVGGATYTRDPALPLETIRPGLDTVTLPEHGEIDEPIRIDNEQFLGAVRNVADPRGPDQPEATNRNFPPYWGSFPQAERGAMDDITTSYGSSGDNYRGPAASVDPVAEFPRGAGHGSTSGDPSEQHHHPGRSTTPESFHIAGSVAHFPRGGVYNTVSGHGSQDKEARRHRRHSASALFAAGIQAERQKSLGGPAAFSDTRDVAPGFLPETAVRDDVLLAEAASRGAGLKHSVASGLGPREQPRRAFPLAGAADPGAGLGAPELADQETTGQPRVDRGSRTSAPPDESNQREVAGGFATGEGQSQKDELPHEQGSLKSEKKHKILSIFHRHKDAAAKEDKTTSRARSKSSGDRPGRAKAQEDSGAQAHNLLRKHSKGAAAMERKTSPESAKEDHPSHSKEKAAAGAAAGAGVLGLFHRKKNEDKNTESYQGTGNPELSADAGGGGPAGEAPRQTEQVPTAFEHPREPPMPPSAAGGAPQWTSTAGDPGEYNVLASGTPSGVKHTMSSTVQPASKETNEPGHYNTLTYGTPSGVKPAPAAGATRKDVVASELGDYNVLKSSGTSPAVKHASSQFGGVLTQEPGDYNVLGSGIPSGVGRDGARAPGRAEERSAANSESAAGDAAEYNVLPSGTPSGVKVKPRERRRTTSPVMHSQNRDRQGRHNTLASGAASGAASGINPGPRPSPPIDGWARHRDLQDLPAPYAPPNPADMLARPPDTSASSPQHAAPASQPSHEASSQPPNPPPQDSLRGGITTTHPHAETIHNLSPEVMPDTYTTASSSPAAPAAPCPPPLTPSRSPPATTTMTSTLPYPEIVHQFSPDDLTSGGAQKGASFPSDVGRVGVQPAAAAAADEDDAGLKREGEGLAAAPSNNLDTTAMVAGSGSGSGSGLGGLASTTGAGREKEKERERERERDRGGGAAATSEAPSSAAVDPALAAATASWAGYAGRTSGVGAGVGAGVGEGWGWGMWMGNRVMHKCQHCGRDNDISGYFGREGMGGGSAGLWRGTGRTGWTG